jgi:membrane-associated protease RseP (regulator of RpoE activity)
MQAYRYWKEAYKLMKKFPFLHFLLFILTLFSTLIAGAFLTGIDLLKEPGKIYKGLPFALTLMVILLSHELSHYFSSRKHSVKATLPYFIPAPTLIGTLGAVIKMKSPIITRKALVDIGASGPIAGFIVSVIATIIGLNMSEIVNLAHNEGALSFGNSILFSFLTRVVLGVIPPGHDILLHPVAFAGWIGFFVTSINLIPVGQLDGGHIVYALFGENLHKKTSEIFFIALLFLGFTKLFLDNNLFTVADNIHYYADKYLWEGWALWAGLLLILGLKHPPVLYWETQLDSKRRFAGWFAFMIFILTFIPVPFKIS